MTQPTPNLNRRTFLQAGTAGLAAASVIGSVSAAQDKSAGGIPLRPLGRTAEKVTMIGLGGFHAAVPEPESDCLRLIQRAVDEGLPSSTMPGTTWTARPKSAWARLWPRVAAAIRSSS